MFPTDLAGLLILLGVSATLVWAAVSDVLHRKIPNLAVLALLAFYVVLLVAQRGDGVGSGLLAGLIAFVIGYGLYATGVMGAGDAKLFAAGALFAGMANLATFSLATVLAGGVMAVVALALRPRRAAVMLAMEGKGDFGRGIPFGVAIAVGGLVTFWGLRLGYLPLTGFQ